MRQSFAEPLLGLSFVVRDPVPETSADVYRRKAVQAGAGAAINEIEFQIRGPKGVVDDLVKVDVAAVRNQRCFWRELLPHPGDVLVLAVDACPCDGGEFSVCGGLVDHERELVAALAFVDVRLEVEIVVAVVHVEGGLNVVLTELDGVGAFAVYGVLEVAAALDFPTVVDSAATCYRQGKNHGEWCEMLFHFYFLCAEKHTPKLEIIFCQNV